MKLAKGVSIILSVILLLSLVLVGCSSPDPNTVPKTEQPAAENNDQNKQAETKGEQPAAEKPADMATAVYRSTGYFDVPQSIHSNPWAPPGPGWIGDYVYQRLFDYLPAGNDYAPMLGASFVDDGNKTIINLRKDVVWSDGKPFTAKDVVCTYNIGLLAGWSVWRYVKSIEAQDDNTVVFTWKKPGSITKPVAFNNYVHSPYHIYGKWADQMAKFVDKRDEKGGFDDATAAEIAKIREDLYNFKPAITDIVGTGPFVCVNVTPSEAVLKKNDKFYAADNIKFSEARLMRVTSNEVVWSAVMANQLDMQNHGMPKDVVDQVAQKQPQYKLMLPWDYTQFSLIFNTAKYPMSEVKFRQAMAYAVDRETTKKVANFFSGPGDTYETGILPSQQGNWLTQDFLDTLTNYTYDLGKAETLLKEMGWTKGTDGMWKDAKGKAIQLELTAPAGYNEFVLGGENIADQLTKFGIKTEFKAIDTDAFWQYMDQGQHEIAIDFIMVQWGFGHPYITYNHMFNDTALRVGLRDPKDSNWKPSLPVTLKSGEKVDPYVLINDLTYATEDGEQKEIIKKLAEVSNQLVLGVPFCEKQVQWMANSDTITGWPEDVNDPIWWGAGGNNASIRMMIEGKLAPKK